MKKVNKVFLHYQTKRFSIFKKKNYILLYIKNSCKILSKKKEDISKKSKRKYQYDRKQYRHSLNKRNLGKKKKKHQYACNLCNNLSRQKKQKARICV